MKVDQHHGTVCRIEDRYVVLLLDDGKEKPVLLSALPRKYKLGDRLYWSNSRWITEKEAKKKRNASLRTFRALLKGE